MAIRDDRIAAESVGINITKYKLIAFSLSAAIAGMAGVLYSHNLSSLMATPQNFGYNMSIMILVFVVLGGIGSVRGSIIAAAILTLLPELMHRSENTGRLFLKLVNIPIPVPDNHAGSHGSHFKHIQLSPPVAFSLERAIEYIEPDELVEATPHFIRLRKRILNRFPG